MIITPRLFRRAPLLLSALAVTLLATGCMSQSPAARRVGPTATEDLLGFCEDLGTRAQPTAETYCYQQVDLATRMPQVFEDRRAVWDYLQLDGEEVIRTRETRADQSYEDYQADRDAQIELWATQEASDAASSLRDSLTIEAGYRNDAVRDCIRAGHNETLCLLDPENPEGN